VKITSIALYVNFSRPLAKETAMRVTALAARHGVRLGICDGGDDAVDFPTECSLDEAELMVTVGGDGTLLRGARLAHPLGIPILGVNTGRLGFLTEVEADEDGFTALGRVFEGDVEFDDRLALHARVNDDDETHFALNEVTVRRVTSARLAPFGLALDGETIAHLPSDGVIVSTPTGSTGYFLSAGGPIIHPAVDTLGVAGLMPHTLFARPLLVPSSATIEISCDGELVSAALETDGIVAADLRAGDRVTVNRAAEPVRFARVRPGAFFARLEDKLQWGVPIKSR
jgi:NAD+ kinase